MLDDVAEQFKEGKQHEEHDEGGKHQEEELQEAAEDVLVQCPSGREAQEAAPRSPVAPDAGIRADAVPAQSTG